MAKEDASLREEMERLEIEPIKRKRSKNDENPFVRHSGKGLIKKVSDQNSSCCCNPIKKSINNGIWKRKQNKILKEPVLHILKSCVSHKTDDQKECQQEQSEVRVSINTDSVNLCTLVKTCNQLKISNDMNNETKSKNGDDKTKWWKNEVVCSRDSRKQQQNNQTGSCSQQALNPPCDITIDELASYFETLVHIPKKMSSMAEMMYI